jgi:hypothetical protein
MRFRCILTLVATTILLTTATLASAQPTTVHVSPVAGNPTASGTNLLSALAGITTASSANPYVLKLDPGIYDVGTTIVQMKAYVDIEGSGQQSTILRGPGNNDSGGLTSIVKGAAPAELRNLQVLSQGTAGQAASIAVELPGTATSVRDVTLNSSGAMVNWGLRNISASPTILNVGVTVSGGTYAYGISNTGGGGSPAVIKQAVINVTGATNNYGIYNDGAAAVAEVRDVEVTATGGTNNYGFYANYGATGLTVEIDNSNLFASPNNAYGVYITGNSATLVVSHTNLTALHSFFIGGSSYGVWTNVGSTIETDQSVIYGITRSLYVPVGTAYVGASRLSGSVTIGTPHCAASYNGSWVALGSGCI